jgi:hypothetical protein
VALVQDIKVRRNFILAENEFARAIGFLTPDCQNFVANFVVKAMKEIFGFTRH